MSDVLDPVLPVDGDGNVYISPEWGYRSQKIITFIGGTVNAIGDHDGTADPTTIFVVTGDVEIRVHAVTTTNLVGAATIELGMTGDTAAILPQVSDATTMDEHEIWHMTDGTVDSGLEAITVSPKKILSNGQDMIMTLASANITAGVLRFVCHWYPVSDGAKVVASTV